MWIRTNYQFDEPAVILRLSVRTVAACKFRDELAKLDGSQPEIIRKAVEELVRFYQPSLAGGIVYSLSLTGGMQWEVLYAHPSLPTCSRVNVPDYMDLIPNERRPDQVAIDEPQVGRHS